jgi:hypothetical protein
MLPCQEALLNGKLAIGDVREYVARAMVGGCLASAATKGMHNKSWY